MRIRMAVDVIHNALPCEPKSLWEKQLEKSDGSLLLSHSLSRASKRASCNIQGKLYILSQPMSWTNHSTAVQNTHAPILYVSLCWKWKREEEEEEYNKSLRCSIAYSILLYSFCYQMKKKKNKMMNKENKVTQVYISLTTANMVENSRCFFVKPDVAIWPLTHDPVIVQQQQPKTTLLDASL